MATLATEEGAGPGKRGEQQSLPSPAARSPLGLGVCECVSVLAKSSLRGDSAAWALRPAAHGLPLRRRLVPALGRGSGASPPQPPSSVRVQRGA